MATGQTNGEGSQLVEYFEIFESFFKGFKDALSGIVPLVQLAQG